MTDIGGDGLPDLQGNFLSNATSVNARMTNYNYNAANGAGGSGAALFGTANGGGWRGKVNLGGAPWTQELQINRLNISLSVQKENAFNTAVAGLTGIRSGWLEAKSSLNNGTAKVDVLRFVFDDASTAAPAYNAATVYSEYVAAAVPEPSSSLALLALGAGGLLMRRRL